MNCIAAVSSEWGLGKNNQLLFHIAEDLKRFRRLTTGGTLILGRKTLESFPGRRPLPNRRHLVLTRQAAYHADGVEIFHSVEDVLKTAKDIPEDLIWVAGGGEIYRAFLPYCRTAYITLVNDSPASDTFFPDLSADPMWKLINESELFRDESSEKALSYKFCEYTNLAPVQNR